MGKSSKLQRWLERYVKAKKIGCKKSTRSTYYKINNRILRVSDHVAVTSDGDLSIVQDSHDADRYIVHAVKTGQMSILTYEETKTLVRSIMLLPAVMYIANAKYETLVSCGSDLIVDKSVTVDKSAEIKDAIRKSALEQLVLGVPLSKFKQGTQSIINGAVRKARCEKLVFSKSSLRLGVNYNFNLNIIKMREKLKKFIAACLCTLVVALLALLASCDKFGQKDQEYDPTDSVCVAEYIEEVVNPIFESTQEVMAFQEKLNEQYSIDETFRNLPTDVLNNVATVCIKKYAVTSKENIVEEYKANRDVYDNLDNKAAQERKDSVKPDLPPSSVSYHYEIDTTGGKHTKVLVKEERYEQHDD